MQAEEDVGDDKADANDVTQGDDGESEDEAGDTSASRR